MFYVKFCGIKIEIDNDNVYARCPSCGKEHVVDLQDILADGDSDLCGTQVYCAQCSRARAHQREQSGAVEIGLTDEQK